MTFTFKTILLTNDFDSKKSSAFASIYLLASIMYCYLFFFGGGYLPVLLKYCCIFWTPEYNMTFFANRACKLLKFVSMVSMFLTISGGKQNNCCNGA